MTLPSTSLLGFRGAGLCLKELQRGLGLGSGRMGLQIGISAQTEQVSAQIEGRVGSWDCEGVCAPRWAAAGGGFSRALWVQDGMFSLCCSHFLSLSLPLH